MKTQLVNTARISISNFTFALIFAGEWYVTFYSTKTNKSWSRLITNYDMPNSILRSCEPLQKDLITLKKLCKNGN